MRKSTYVMSLVLLFVVVTASGCKATPTPAPTPAPVIGLPEHTQINFFQGFSSDGQYLITFFYPITTSALPYAKDVSATERQRVNSNPEAPPSGQGSPVSLPASLPDRPATRIVIPVIDVDRPVVVAPFRNGTWDMEQITHHVAHLQGTANPGDSNNVVLAGHFALSDGSLGPFAELGNLKREDQILAYGDDGTVYVYTVDSMKVVERTAIEVTLPTSDPTLTLITCRDRDPDEGLFQDRLVVVAHLSEIQEGVKIKPAIALQQVTSVKSLACYTGEEKCSGCSLRLAIGHGAKGVT